MDRHINGLPPNIGLEKMGPQAVVWYQKVMCRAKGLIYNEAVTGLCNRADAAHKIITNLYIEVYLFEFKQFKTAHLSSSPWWC